METFAATLGAILVVLVARFVAQTGSDPLVQYPVLALSGGLTLFALWRLYRSLIKPLAERVAVQERTQRRAENDAYVARWRYRRLVDHLRERGVDIPDDVAYAAPPRRAYPYPDEVGDEEAIGWSGI